MVRCSPRSGQTKDYNIDMCYFYAKHAALRRKIKDQRLGIRIMCLNRATCLSVDCCFSELALYNNHNRVGLVQSGPHHHPIEN